MNIWIMVLILLTGASLVTNGVMIANKQKKTDIKPTPTVEVSSTTLSTPTNIVEMSPTPTTKQKAQQNQVKNTATPTTASTYIQPTTQIVNQPTSSYVQPAKKTDYSSYQTALSAKLASLQSRLNSVRSQADNVPNEVATAIANVDASIASLQAQETNAVNNQTAITAGEMGKRGISGALADQEIANAVAPIKAQYEGQISQLENSKNQIRQNGINKVTQLASQDQDLTNKIATVQSLLNKLMSGSFTDSDIPLAIQANSY